ncbi:hypothetical protein BLOT_004406 [Blomia tropicalis]|nr:hypothetical protein BLOT_004406 [Blomia tropicalis]
MSLYRFEVDNDDDELDLELNSRFVPTRGNVHIPLIVLFLSFDYGADVYLHHHQQQQHPLPVVRVNRSAGHTSTTLNFSSEPTLTIPSGQLVEMCILRSGTRTSHVPFAGRVPMPMLVL